MGAPTNPNTRPTFCLMSLQQVFFEGGAKVNRAYVLTSPGGSRGMVAVRQQPRWHLVLLLWATPANWIA